jgi:hypothetical protein
VDVFCMVNQTLTTFSGLAARGRRLPPPVNFAQETCASRR